MRFLSGVARRLSVLAVMVAVMVAAMSSAMSAQSTAFARAAHLKRGINLSMWYAQSSDQSASRLASFTTPEDFKLIRSLGFDHVRLSIDPVPLIAEKQSGSLRPEAMARLDRTVQQITAEGLVVVLDIHPEQPWKDELLKGDDGVWRFLAFWMNFSEHFAKTDPEKVYFEIFNEPNMDDLYRWAGIEARAVATIRLQAPHHTVIATGAQWGKMDSLLAMEPLSDNNVIYTFHDYDPMWFTHQGANWGSQYWTWLRGLPYPSSPEAVAPFLKQEPDARVRLWVTRYGLERWSAERLEGELAQAADWAKRRNVPLWVGEFGVYRDYAPPAARAQWIRDMRRAMEGQGIGWAMWDYQGSFGVVTKKDGKTIVDEAVLAALGLKR